MSRNIYLVVYLEHDPQPEALHLPAHWAIFIPSTDPRDAACTTFGRLISCSGVQGPSSGAFYSSYEPSVMYTNMNRAQKKYSKFLLGMIDDKYAEDEDLLEEKAKLVKVPEWSRGNLDEYCGEDHQAWIRYFLEMLVRDGILDRVALDILAIAPKHCEDESWEVPLRLVSTG